jgi:plastocyanin
MTRLRILLAPCLLVLALAGAGCGSDNQGAGDSGAANTLSDKTTASEPAAGSDDNAAGGEVEVKMKNIAFDPKDVNVKVGQTIKWENEDTVDHNVVAKSGADFKSDLFGKGGTYSTKVTKAGEIDYVCTVHPGMDGKITVTE